MRTINLLFFFLAFFNLEYTNAQLQVLTHYSNYSPFYLNNLNDINILNSSAASVNADIDILLSEVPNMALVVTAHATLSLQPGINNILNQQFEYIFSPTESGSLFAAHGILETGNFQICVRVKNKKQNEIFNNACEEIMLNNNHVLHLLAPLNKEEIFTLNPLLQWVSTFPGGTTYHLRVVPMLPFHTAEEALGQGNPYIDIDLKEIIFPYSYSFPILEYGAKYAWQVYALSSSRNIIAFSESWIFTPVKKEFKTIETPDCYRLIHRELNNGNYLFKGYIKFGYVNSTHEELLKYSIYDVSTGTACKDLPIILLSSGLNKININLREISGIKKKHSYVLKIHNQYLEKYEFSFVLNSKN